MRQTRYRLQEPLYERIEDVSNRFIVASPFVGGVFLGGTSAKFHRSAYWKPGVLMGSPHLLLLEERFEAFDVRRILPDIHHSLETNIYGTHSQ